MNTCFRASGLGATSNLCAANSFTATDVATGTTAVFTDLTDLIFRTHRLPRRARSRSLGAFPDRATFQFVGGFTICHSRTRRPPQCFD